MLKRLFFCLFTFSMVTLGVAQDFKPLQNDSKQAKSKPNTDFGGDEIIPKSFALSIGPKLGGNYTIVGEPSIPMGMSGSIGYSGGIAANLRFCKRPYTKFADTGRFGIQVEALYAQRSVSNDYEDIKMSGIEVPVLFQWWFAERFCIEAGPTFFTSLSTSPDEMVTNNATLVTKDMKPNDAMVTVGAEYKHKNGLTASVRFNLGNSEMAGNFDSKVSTVSFAIGWLFSVAK